MSIRTWDCLLAGRLANEYDSLPNPGWTPAFINDNFNVQLVIKVMSDTPENLRSDGYFSCWENKIPAFPSELYPDDEERLNKLTEYLSDKIILFRPSEKQDLYDRSKRLYRAEPSTILSMPDGILPDTRLIPVLYLPDIEPQEFEQNIFGHRTLRINPQSFPKEMPVADSNIVWAGGYLYGFFESMRPAHNGWGLSGDDIRKIPLDIGEYESLILPYKNIAYIDADTYFQQLCTLLEKEGQPVEPVIERIDDSMGERTDERAVDTTDAKDHVAPTTDDLTPQLIPDNPVDTVVVDATNGRQLSSANSADASDQPVIASEADQTSEHDFFNRLNALIQTRQLFYHEQDLLNFHTALKTGSLVLLSGMSGTGKSQLVQVYSEALGLGENQFQMITIQPTWTDGSDLLGFLDLTHNVYRPADSGLVDLLVNAENSPDKLFLVCFDEMNLARVEHYFAQFISALELDAKRRSVQLYNESVESRIYNSDKYPARVDIGRNVLFVGTINIDESTYAFSDKVLDRAHVIRLQVVPFSNLLRPGDEPDLRVAARETLFTAYDEWRDLSPQIDLTELELEFLEHVHVELQKIDLQRGIGYRSLRQINNYLKNIPLDDDAQPLMDRSTAFDLQLIQKVLTKLRGPREQLESLIGTLDDHGRLSNSKMIELMDEYEEISGFELSRREIFHKAKELRSYGYAS